MKAPWLVVPALVATLFAPRAAPASPPGIKVGDKAPEWEFKEWFNTPRPYTVAQLAGKAILLEFWATW